jgi:hypothetical protein
MAEQKGELGKRDRAKIAAARPFLKGSTKNCQLHIEVSCRCAESCLLAVPSALVLAGAACCCTTIPVIALS